MISVSQAQVACRARHNKESYLDIVMVGAVCPWWRWSRSAPSEAKTIQTPACSEVIPLTIRFSRK